ncbi:CIC11C00000001320 [Sungouiella intermedia]|uniref:CIC11C00000001320 n=1 Tax=Sungouiella intermedia TaxID=45354 RepID=A0A1L0C1A8_9ASCO|nr:CIC11C00000001320 [[Candida] intermedia]
MSAQDDLRSLFSDFSDNDLVIDQIDAELNEALREQLANESASAAVVKSPLPDYSGAFQPTALHPADPLSVNELAWFQFPKMSEPITEPTNNFQPVPTMQPIEIKPIPDSTEPNPATVAATYLLLENFPSSPKEVFSKFMTLNTPVETTLKPSTNSFTYNFLVKMWVLSLCPYVTLLNSLLMTSLSHFH